MSTSSVRATRSELLRIKKRIKLSEKGHRLLKMKRDGLMKEFMSSLEQARDARESLNKEYADAQIKMGQANAIDGAIVVKSAALAISTVPSVDVEIESVMGVKAPITRAETEIVHNALDRGYGIIGTSPRIDETAKAYEKTLEAVIDVAGHETRESKILDEIDKVKRRVNALEYKIIPRLEENQKFIRFRLEELERENIYRLKKIKQSKGG